MSNNSLNIDNNLGDSQSQPPFQPPRVEKMKVLSLLRCDGILNDTDWDIIRKYLDCMKPMVFTEYNTRQSILDDPMGRVLIVDIITKNPPIDVVQKALCVFPDALQNNVASFFAACKYCKISSSGDYDVIRFMIRHILQRQQQYQQHQQQEKDITNNEMTMKTIDDDTYCPYPWIVISLISVEGTRILIEEYPLGVLQSPPTGYFSPNLCPLDNMISSASMMTSENSLDTKWLEKLKLMLMIEEHGTIGYSMQIEDRQGTCNPVHVFVRRVVSRLLVGPLQQDGKVLKRIVWSLRQWYSMEPYEFQKPNNDGDYPLHVALKEKFSSSCGSRQSSSSTSSSRNSEAAKNIATFGRELIDVLLKAHPQSGSIVSRDESRLPLNLAIENGWGHCCYDLLLAAAPYALQTLDTKTSLYPFQHAATVAVETTTSSSSSSSSSEEEDNTTTKGRSISMKSSRRQKRKKIQRCGSSDRCSVSALDVTYKLLREDPLQARGLLDGSPLKT